MIDIACRSLERESPALYGIVRESLAGAAGADGRLLRFGLEAWSRGEIHIPDEHLAANVRTWHAELEERLAQRLLSTARVMIGDWNAGAYSIRCGEDVHIYCGSVEALGHVLKHEILHYYLRKLLPARLVGSDCEERIVQYETCWYADDREFDLWHPRLQRISHEFNRKPFIGHDFTSALEEFA